MKTWLNFLSQCLDTLNRYGEALSGLSSFIEVWIAWKTLRLHERGPKRKSQDQSKAPVTLQMKEDQIILLFSKVIALEEQIAILSSKVITLVEATATEISQPPGILAPVDSSPTPIAAYRVPTVPKPQPPSIPRALPPRPLPLRLPQLPRYSPPGAGSFARCSRWT